MTAHSNDLFDLTKADVDEPRVIPALTVRQPWASLIVAGQKRFETRSWKPPRSLIGETLAIHAGAHVPKLRDLNGPEADAVAQALQIDAAGWEHLPRGAVIGTVVVAFAGSVLNVRGRRLLVLPTDVSQPFSLTLAQREALFGDFSGGRWLWALTEARPIRPVSTLGRQGIWKWSGDAGFHRSLCDS